MSQNYENDYLPCLSYQGYDRNSKGISYFFEENKFYFAYCDDSGQVILRSEGYTTELARENGINSVLNNLNEDKQYTAVQTENGKWVLILKAKNHQEIARTCPVSSELEAKQFLPSERTKAAELKRSSTKLKETEDDYLICREYEEQIQQKNSKYTDFISFRHSNGQYYFAWTNHTDEILLRSEGYATESARDNGIESVRKNIELEERYKLEEHHGAHFAILRAGNNQEIARSCPHRTALEVKALLPSERAKKKNMLTSKSMDVDDYLICREYEEMKFKKSPMFPDFISFQHENGKYYFAWTDGSDQILLRSEAYHSDTARDNGIESVMRNLHLEERFKLEEHHGAHFCVLKAANNQEIARSCPYHTSEEAKAILPSERSKHKQNLAATKGPEDDYLICREYEEQISKRSSLYPDFIRFQHENGKHYFAWVSDDNKILLRSEAYESEAGRDSGIRSVLKNKVNRNLFHVEEHHGAHFLILKAENNQEIARSCPKKSAEETWNLIAPPVKADATLAEPKLTAEIKSQVIPPPLPVVENKIEAVKELPKVEEKKMDKVDPVPTLSKPVEVKKEEPVQKEKVITPIVPIEKPKAPPVEKTKVESVKPIMPIKESRPVEIIPEEETSSGFNWKWLLPLLLLPLLFLWWKSCNGKSNDVSVQQTNQPIQNITAEVANTSISTHAELNSGTTNDSITKDQKAGSSAIETKSENTISSCNLHWILFDYDKSEITLAADREIQNWIAILKDHNDWQINLTAHTDSKGSQHYNDELSSQRAKAVQGKLLLAGISKNRIKLTADSENKPLAKNTDDDSGRKYNRRVEIQVLDKNNKPVCQSIAPEIPVELKI